MDFTQISVNMKDASDLGLGCRIKPPNIASIVFAIVQTVVPGFMLSPEISGCSGLSSSILYCGLHLGLYSLMSAPGGEVSSHSLLETL